MSTEDGATRAPSGVAGTRGRARTEVIGVLDLGLGNLASVAHAVEAVGFTPCSSGEPAELEDAAGLILPGVGAFAAAADRLRTTGGAALVERFLARGRPVMGICLGLQLMCAWGEEGGGSPGLGLIEAQVRHLPGGLPVPHVGWNRVFWSEGMTLFAGLEPGAWFYFSHAYFVDGSCPPRVAGRPSRAGATRYGVPVLAALENPPLYGVQFHPEKSGAAGLKVLGAFGQCCLR